MITRNRTTVTPRSRNETPRSSVSNKIIRWLLRYPFQRVEDLTLALETSEKTVYRHLARLSEERLVEHITPSLTVKTTCRLYYLSQKGLLIASHQEETSTEAAVDAYEQASALARYWQADEQALLPLLPRLQALLRLQDLVNGLVAQAPGMLAHTGGHRAELAWHWRRDYCYPFLDHEHQWSYEADAALYFHRKAQTMLKGEDYCALLFIDADLASNDNTRQIRRRLEAALRYRAQVERGYPQAPVPMFPPLIVLTRTQRQQEIWQHQAARIANTLHVAPLIGAVAVVPPEQSLENVWTLPWQKLSVAASCRLRDLFLPLAREALPPGLLRPSGLPVKTTDHERPLLRGVFMQRARTVSPSPQMEEEEQEAVSLLGLCFSQRHVEMLYLLYRSPLLNIEEMAAFLNLQNETVIRYLYELRRYSCVERYIVEQEERWHLSPRGLRFLAASRHVLLEDIAEPEPEGEQGDIIQRGLARLKRSLPLTLAAYTFFSALSDEMYASCENGQERNTLWWEMGNHCEHRYTYRGTRYTLRPAAAFIYKSYKTDKAEKVGQRRLSAWVEWDGLSTNESNLASRLENYAHFVHSREWIAAGLSTLPMLLIVTSDTRRATAITELVQQHLAGTGMIVRLSTTASVATHGPLASIWRQLLPLPDDSTGRGNKKREPAQRPLLDTRQQTV
jgi:predicted transcriptional regulator